MRDVMRMREALLFLVDNEVDRALCPARDGLRFMARNGAKAETSKELPELGAGKSQSIKVTLTPAARAIAGDYQTTIRAGSAGGLSESANFRITVLTSTVWGAVGIGVIAAALLVVVFAVARFGRR